MSELSERLVKEARSWKGTPFRYQGNIKGLGVDCAQFVALVARDAGIDGVDIPHNYRPQQDGAVMLKLLHEHMEQIEQSEMEPGDVLALCDERLKHPNIPRHLVFVSAVTPKTVFIVHASAHGVREHRTDTSWTRRIHSVWRLK